ncbi:INGR2 protein, partial [Smithornis capensis]|nr:INGR2 protein [Smithornis capensis]
EPPPRLPAPKDVEIYSYNFHSLLRWSPVEVEGVLYTVQYKTGAFPVWSEMNCTRSPQPQCGFPPGLRRRWTVSLRVRAELGTATSPWVCQGPFVPEWNTTLGPPRVTNVSASPDSLLLRVTPPFTPELRDNVFYLVSYWENSTRAVQKELVESNTLFQIGNLKESTLYCFSVRVGLGTDTGDLLLGQQSAPQCHRTGTS